MEELQRTYSSWVDAYAYDNGTLVLRFKDATGAITATCMYEHVPFDLFLSFLTAGSKGKWVHAHLMGWPYVDLGTGLSSFVGPSRY